MIGNAYEWLEDYWHDSYTGAPDDGSAWLIPTSSNRLLRGAWWGALDYNCRTTLRNKYDPDTRECFTGFRIVSNP